ncbi:MAG: TonB-dependent receptor, partial [Candidatus Saccharimonadales bacterium]
YLAAAVTLGGRNMNGNPPMQVIVDGVALSPGSGIDDINLNDIASVEVYKSSGLGISGAEGMGGVLCVYTFNGAAPLDDQQTASGTLNITLPGFYQARGFYVPKYDTQGNNVNHRDTRPTVYWDTDLATDTNGRASFSYYGANGKGTYRIVIEGIDENGNIGWQAYSYRVQ